MVLPTAPLDLMTQDEYLSVFCINCQDALRIDSYVKLCPTCDNLVEWRNKSHLMVVSQKPKPRIVVGINSLVSTVHCAYSNHIQFFFRLGRNYPQYDFILNNPARCSIDRMRNMSAQLAMECNADYVLMLDDDVLVPFDALSGLLAADADIIAADVMIRGYPFNHMLFQWNEDKTGLTTMEDVPEPRGVIDIGAVGCSLTLIKTSVFLRTPQPYFVTGPETNTEDIYFCLRAAKAIPDLTIKADTRIICPHVLWEETISSHNRKHYKEYYERQFGIPEKETQDRGDDYLERVEKVMA